MPNCKADIAKIWSERQTDEAQFVHRDERKTGERSISR